MDFSFIFISPHSGIKGFEDEGGSAMLEQNIGKNNGTPFPHRKICVFSVFF